MTFPKLPLPKLTLPKLTFRTLAVVSSISVASCVFLMVLRIASAVSFSEPMQLTTSGWEQETLFPIWKAINGLEVYASLYKIPFMVTPYNWLFIEIYAVFSDTVLSLFSLEDAWLPTVGRFLTLALLFVGTAVSYASFLTFLKTPDRAIKILCLSFSVFIFFGPLVGFWGFTVRADVGALMFEIVAIFLFWKFYDSRPFLAVLLCAVAAYCAWGFKQVNVVSTVTVGLYLLYHRDWKPLFLFCGILITAFTATFLIGGSLYFWGFFEGARHGLSLERFLINGKNFIFKSAPYFAALAAVALATARSSRFRRFWLNDKSALLVLMGLCSAAIINMLISTKVGSADHYYFVFTYFVALASLKGYTFIREEIAGQDSRVPVKSVLGISMLGWAANMVAIAVVLFGLKGMVSVAPQNEFYSAAKKCMEPLQKPVFTELAYLSLPWMNPSEQNFVITWSYYDERRKGLEFEKDGIGGLIEEGYFGSLLLNGDGSNEFFDGARLDKNYEKLSTPCVVGPLYQRRKFSNG